MQSIIETLNPVFRSTAPQTPLLKAFAEMTGMQPLHQDDLDKGEVTFAQMWQENV